MRFLIVGAGSIGGYFGARLMQAGADVTFLVREARAAQLRTTGLQVISPLGDVTLAPKLVTADSLTDQFDAIILSVKAYGLDGAIRDMAPAIGPDSMILPLLNGMRHVEVLTQAFGTKALIGGLCKISTTLDEAGRVLQFGRMQEFVYGEMDGATSPRIQALDRIAAPAITGARLSDDIALEMWEKWTMLSSLGAITCLMRGTIGEVAATPHGRDVATALVAEVVATITAAGRAPRPALVENVRTMMMQEGSPLTSSMYRDMMQGFAVEADQILGDLVARAKAAGLGVPLLTAAHTHLAVYQAKRAG